MVLQIFINQVKEWIALQGYLTTSFVDRGDPDTWDFSDATLIQDGNWHDLDLSAIVPANAKAVLGYMIVKDDSVDSYFQVRTNGHVHAISRSGIRTQVANVFNDGDVVMYPDANRKIEYRCSAGDWTRIYLHIKGWWL